MASWTYVVQPNDNARLTRVRTLCDFPLRLSRRESYRGGQQTLLPNASFVFKYGLKVINLPFVVSLSRAPAITAFYESFGSICPRHGYFPSSPLRYSMVTSSSFAFNSLSSL
jgi:hypothetical protein